MSKSELRRLEIVAPEAIKQLREQIAQEIEATVSGSCPNLDCNCYVVAAAIARDEPNQVTKDAIEEARKMK